MRRAACIHATSAQEYDELRAFGLRHPIAVIPNGIDLPKEVRELPPDAPERTTCDRVVLSLGRIHPKKGLENLLQAWARIEPAYPGWRLSLIGPGEERYVDELRAMSRTLGLSRVSFGEPVYGAAKWAAYRHCRSLRIAEPERKFRPDGRRGSRRGYAGDRDSGHTLAPGRDRRKRLAR